MKYKKKKSWYKKYVSNKKCVDFWNCLQLYNSHRYTWCDTTVWCFFLHTHFHLRHILTYTVCIVGKSLFHKCCWFFVPVQNTWVYFISWFELLLLCVFYKIIFSTKSPSLLIWKYLKTFFMQFIFWKVLLQKKKKQGKKPHKISNKIYKKLVLCHCRLFFTEIFHFISTLEYVGDRYTHERQSWGKNIWSIYLFKYNYHSIDSDSLVFYIFILPFLYVFSWTKKNFIVGKKVI